jgi:hypothetical protein
MSIQQPLSTDKLNNPDHSLSHRVFSNDDASPAESVVTDSSGNVGIGTITPNSKLNVAGSFATAFINKTANYTVTDSDSLISLDATIADFTITLPTAVGITGRQYTFKKIDSTNNSITIDAYLTQTIDGELTQVIYDQWTSLTIVSNGSNWFII